LRADWRENPCTTRILVEVHHENETQEFSGKPPDRWHVCESAGNLLLQSCAFALELLDGAAGVCHNLSQLSFGGFDLAVEVSERSVALVKETAGISERGGGGWLAWKGIEGHGGKMRDGQKEGTE
jgi:hypothetical protein